MIKFYYIPYFISDSDFMNNLEIKDVSQSHEKMLITKLRDGI